MKQATEDFHILPLMPSKQKSGNLKRHLKKLLPEDAQLAPKHNSTYMKMDTLKKNKKSEENRRVSVRIEPLEL